MGNFDKVIPTFETRERAGAGVPQNKVRVLNRSTYLSELIVLGISHACTFDLNLLQLQLTEVRNG